MTAKPEPTPETDGLEFEMTQYLSTGQKAKLKVVQSHDVRDLERRLAAANRRIAELEKVIPCDCGAA